MQSNADVLGTKNGEQIFQEGNQHTKRQPHRRRTNELATGAKTEAQGVHEQPTLGLTIPNLQSAFLTNM